MSKRKPIQIRLGLTRLLKAEAKYPGAVVTTIKGNLLVLITDHDEITVRTLECGDEVGLGGEPTARSEHRITVNGVNYHGKIQLRPKDWAHKYPCTYSKRREEEKGWIQRRYDELQFRRNGQSSWRATSRPSASAVNALRDVCERAAAHVLELFPGLPAIGAEAGIRGKLGFNTTREPCSQGCKPR